MEIMFEEKVATGQREQFIDVTRQVQKAVQQSGVQQGACLVVIPHTTAGVTIQENADPDVTRDLLMALEHIVPAKLPYRHSEGNSTAHIKTALTGSSVTVPIQDGQLALGTWQCIYFCEFDGPRARRMLIQILPVAEC